MNDKLLEMFPDNTILAGYRGSISHNTYVPKDMPNSSDDIDLMGVFMPPAKSYLGLDTPKEVKETMLNEYDLVSYEFKKTVRMLLKSNPNIMPILWLKKDHYLKKTFYGRALLDNRDLFSSKAAYNAYTGYAHSELLKINKTEFKGYMGAKRKKLVEMYGYDCKHASHSIRLLRMGVEFLDTGVLNVYREKDASELVDIKTGKWTIDEVKDEANRLFSLAKSQVDKSPLPKVPDVEAVNKIVEEIVYDHINNEKRN